MIQQGYKQQQRGSERDWWMRKRKQDSACLQCYRRAGGDQREKEFANALADQPYHRDQVVEIIQKLSEAFHGDALTNDGQHRAATFRITRIGIRVVDV